MVDYMNEMKDATLDQLEDDVRTKIFNYERAGLALELIRNRRLYRQRRFVTFQGYAKKCFDLDKEYLVELISGAQLCQTLRTRINEEFLPKNLSQASILRNVRDTADQVSALRLAWRKSLALDVPLLSISVVQESVMELKEKGRDTIESMLVNVPPLDGEFYRSGDILPSAGGKKQAEVSLRQGDRAGGGDMDSEQSIVVSPDKRNVKPEPMKKRVQDEAGKQKNPKRFKPRFGEPILGSVVFVAHGEKKQKEREVFSAEADEVSSEMNRLAEVPGLLDPVRRRYDKLEISDTSQTTSATAALPMVSVHDGEVSLRLSNYERILNYRSGLNARIACQSLAYMAAMEIGRQANCGCDQTLISFGDEVAMQLERIWEEWILLPDSGESIIEPINGIDLRIRLDQYGQARIRVIRDGAVFKARVSDVVIWNTYRHESSHWPIAMEESDPPKSPAGDAENVKLSQELVV